VTIPITDSPIPAYTLSSAMILETHRDLNRGHQAAEIVYEEYNIGDFSRCGGSSGAHCEADIRSRERRRVVDAVAHHHDGPVLALGDDHQDFLVRRELRPHRIDWKSGGDGFRHLAAVAGRQNDAFDAETPEVR
jgi:hypothetical protein